MASILFLFFAVKTTSEFIAYNHFSKRELCLFKEGRVVEKKGNNFFVYGTFLCEGREVDVLVDGPFPNSFAAEEVLKRYRPENDTISAEIWINVKNRSEGLLRKSLPFKSVISSFILMGIVIYFLYLLRKV